MSSLDHVLLHQLPPPLLWEFCRLMDGLSDRDWTRFASEVLQDQTAVRLAERKERRTDWVMDQWGNTNARLGQLLDLLERQQLLRPRDVIMHWASSLKPSSPLPPLPPAALPTQPMAPPIHSEAPPPMTTFRLTSTVDKRGGRPLPRPGAPPLNLKSVLHQPPPVLSGSGVMRWSHEEVHAGTSGFSPSLKVGEGGFGVVYRATLRKRDCAVKRLKQDTLMDWALLKESFQTEVDKLSKFRHPNIVELLGFSEGGGAVCLIFSYMENRSLEDQLHNNVSLSWSQRLKVIEGASAALQFLHCPPDGPPALIHGDVKSSNILLDVHLQARLSDFGLARSRPPSCSGGQTCSVGRTETVRGTLAYLPEEYVREGQLSTAMDVYSFGVVLLEVLTGRRALERDRTSGDRYLKDLVDEVEDCGSSAAVWRKQLDHRLTSGGAVEHSGCMQLVTLACRCLERKRKKRPAMTTVFDELQLLHDATKESSCSPHQPPPLPRECSVEALSNQLSRLGPLEDSYLLTLPHPLHSSSSLLSSSSLPSSSSSLSGPCETDESRGFSQYDLQSPAGSLKSWSLKSASPQPPDLYGSRTSVGGPEESDELDFLPSERL